MICRERNFIGQVIVCSVLHPYPILCQLFKKIRQAIHVNDNSTAPKRGDPNYDKLYKLRPLIDRINECFQSQCIQTTSQSVDEGMIALKGRSSIKQYMPLKPIKRGYKVWLWCDSSTGYAYQFEVYCGKSSDQTTELSLLFQNHWVPEIFTSHLTIFFLHINLWNNCILEKSMQLPLSGQIGESFLLWHAPVQLSNTVNSSGGFGTTQLKSTGGIPKIYMWWQKLCTKWCGAGKCVLCALSCLRVSV